MSFLESLPSPILQEHILSCLLLRELNRLRSTCKYFHREASKITSLDKLETSVKGLQRIKSVYKNVISMRNLIINLESSDKIPNRLVDVCFRLKASPLHLASEDRLSAVGRGSMCAIMDDYLTRNFLFLDIARHKSHGYKIVFEVYHDDHLILYLEVNPQTLIFPLSIQRYEWKSKLVRNVREIRFLGDDYIDWSFTSHNFPVTKFSGGDINYEKILRDFPSVEKILVDEYNALDKSPENIEKMRAYMSVPEGLEGGVGVTGKIGPIGGHHHVNYVCKKPPLITPDLKRAQKLQRRLQSKRR